MKKIYLILSTFIVACLFSCTKQDANPFATPEGCVKEYLNAVDSCDVARMLNCFSYEPKYERIVREGLQELLDKEARKKASYPDYYYRTDSVKLKEFYPNSAVVTVYCTSGYYKNHIFPDDYDIDLVKDSANWKIETTLSYSIDVR